MLGKILLVCVVIVGLVSAVNSSSAMVFPSGKTVGSHESRVCVFLAWLASLLRGKSGSGDVVVNGGEGYVGGSPSAPMVWAAARKDLRIDVGRAGAPVCIRVNYTISCPGSADDGYVHLEFTDHTHATQAHSGDFAHGHLEIKKFFYPHESLGWKISVEYWDWWHSRLLASDSDTALGHTTFLPGVLLVWDSLHSRGAVGSVTSK